MDVLVVGILLDHHACPAKDAFLMEHVLHCMFLSPSGRRSMMPLAFRMVIILNNNTLERLEVVLRDAWS